MRNFRLLFPEANKAALLEEEYEPAVGRGEVLVKALVSTVSPGTERANITGNPSVAGQNAPKVSFPRQCGYSVAGEVVSVGEGVTNLKPGDKVIAFWGKHDLYRVFSEKKVMKIDEAKISVEEAAALFIATFPLGALRKTRVEIGEAALVMGCGLLGQFGIRLLRAAGATPVIAADPIESRRKEAINSGADYALDPTEEGFKEKVRSLSGGGVSVCLEVTGVGAGLDGALDCMAKFGRIALLGCTRDSNFTIDYYRKVHCPGITMIGAHTMARPKEESHPGYFTDRDDLNALLKLVYSGRLSVKDMLTKAYSPRDCETVYHRIINDRTFPTVAQFDWRLL